MKSPGSTVFIIFASSVLAVLLLLVGCEDIFGRNPPDMSAGQELTRKDVLALQHLREDHISTEEDIARQVSDFITTNSVARSVSAIAPDITSVKKFISKTDKGFSGLTTNARNAAGDSETPEESEIPFYLFELGNKENDTKGFALTCGDDRIGNILAIVENGSPDLDNSFMELYYTNLEAYIGETIELYNSVSDADIEAALKKANEQFSGNARVVDMNTLYDYDTDGKTRLKTAWNQEGSPYWDVLNETKGMAGLSMYNRYVTGCLAVAMAQIMAYWEYPDSCKTDPYKGSKYIWNDMKASPNAEWINAQSLGGDAARAKSAKRAVSTLIYEIAENVVTQYGTLKTDADMYRTVPVFNKFDYKTSDAYPVSYDLNRIKASINQRRPVVSYGFAVKQRKITEYKFLWFILKVEKEGYDKGHAWVIDDYRTRTMQIMAAGNLIGNRMLYLPDDYVRCNLGFGGGKDGWYKNAVFSTNKGPVSRSSAGDAEGFYRYNLQMLPDVCR